MKTGFRRSRTTSGQAVIHSEALYADLGIYMIVSVMKLLGAKQVKKCFHSPRHPVWLDLEKRLIQRDDFLSRTEQSPSRSRTIAFEYTQAHAI